jgi:hypothetical protein
MQVHEVTTQSLNEGNIASAIGNPVAAAKVIFGKGQGAPGTSLASQISATKLQTKVKDIADRTYDAWKNYIYQVERTIDPQDLAAFQNRSDGRYRKELLSWIQTNLSRGLYLPNAQNFGQITNVINQLSGTQQQPKPIQSTQPAQQTQQQAQQQQPITVGKQVIQPNTPQYQAIMQRMQQQSASSPKVVTEAISQAQEKSLWTKLVTLILQSQQAVSDQQQQAQQQQQQQKALINSRNAAQLIQQALNSQGVTQSTLGNINLVLKNINQQGNIIKSTGNPVTDGLLRLLGFSIQ